LAIVLQLQSGLELQSLITPPTSLTLAAAETRQGLYREYTVEKVDDSALKDLRRNYKTAEETDTSKNKVRYQLHHLRYLLCIPHTCHVNHA
jgi:hypothetical protein